MPYMLSVADPIGAMRCRPVPARLLVFTDAGSIGHVLSGAVVGIIPPPWNLAVLSVFGGYELSKHESIERTGGKFIEFGLGLAAAGIFFALGGKL
jgi:hypothetical protein